MRPPRHPSLDGPASRRPGGRAAEQIDEASKLLGGAHPLVRLLGSTRTAFDQALAVAATQAAGVGLLLTHHPVGLELLAAGTFVQLGIGLRMLTLTETRHDLCRDLIIERRAIGPLEVLDREWRRLAMPRHRERLALSLENLVATACRPLPLVPASRPYFDVRIVRPVANELREVARLLRRDHVGVPGVALAERLLTSPGSPIWTGDGEALVEELWRTKYLLLDPSDD
jgi:hypothetical protein